MHWLPFILGKKRIKPMGRSGLCEAKSAYVHGLTAEGGDMIPVQVILGFQKTFPLK
jgi:hypothetical protein